MITDICNQKIKCINCEGDIYIMDSYCKYCGYEQDPHSAKQYKHLLENCTHQLQQSSKFCSICGQYLNSI